MTPPYYNLQVISGGGSNVVIRSLIKQILEHGVSYPSGKYSVNRGFIIQELFNAQMCILEPRNRGFMSALPIFNPGLAVARFFFLLSGSNLLKPIEFYTAAVRDISDDGLTIPGSSYGARIFGLPPRNNLFEMAAEAIMGRSDTKRAVIPIYEASDLGRIDSRDVPCATSISFMPRGRVLHATVSMRANDAVKLVPYNVFELSLLHECMAARTGLELGSYWHTAVSMHIRGDNIARAEKVVAERQTCRDMGRIESFSESLRHQLVQDEQLIREHCSQQVLVKESHRWWKEYGPVWADLLSTLACEAVRKSSVREQRDNTTSKNMVEELLAEHESHGVLLNLYYQFLTQCDLGTTR